jgi:gluconolactonase
MARTGSGQQCPDAKGGSHDLKPKRVPRRNPSDFTTRRLCCALHTPALAQTSLGIPGVLAPGVVPELVQGGFTALEGPVGAADGTVYFSDRMPDRTYHLGLDGKITVYQENTGAANGLAFTRDGDMVRAEGGAKRIGKLTRDGKVSVLTDSYNGKPLVSPNDLIVDAKGGIYFTDPGPRPIMPGRPTNVYYLPAGAKEPILIDDQNPRPNGLTLTLDGRTLLVDNTVGPVVFAFDVQSDGTVKNRRPFLQLQDIPAGKESGADGMAIDREGRIYVTSVVGIQVFDSAGKYLGRLRGARNLAFGGPDKRTLYLTAADGFFRVKMLSQGPERLGK